MMLLFGSHIPACYNQNNVQAYDWHANTLVLLDEKVQIFCGAMIPSLPAQIVVQGSCRYV